MGMIVWVLLRGNGNGSVGLIEREWECGSY